MQPESMIFQNHLHFCNLKIFALKKQWLPFNYKITPRSLGNQKFQSYNNIQKVQEN